MHLLLDGITKAMVNGYSWHEDARGNGWYWGLHLHGRPTIYSPVFNTRGEAFEDLLLSLTCLPEGKGK